MAEEIATLGEGQIKALIMVAGNPVLSTPAGDKLDEVLPRLDAMIAVDLWLNEATRHADVILGQQRRQLLATGVFPLTSHAAQKSGRSSSG